MARKRIKNKLAVPAGIITVILAIVGLVTVIHLTVNFVENQKEKSIKKANYEAFLKPIVMFDPDPFDDLTKADQSQLLYAAVWNLLLDEEGMSKYSYSQGETFGIQVPQADIEASFATLFGNEIDVTALHNTVDMSSYDITYDSALQSYILPITGVDSVYSPKVYNIDKQGSSYVLTVGYIGTKAWADIDDGNYTAPEPDKYMMITLREQRDGSGMYVSSIQETDGQEYVTKSSGEEEYIDEETEVQTEAETTVTEAVSETQPQFETVTDENGEVVTDENGETVTQEVTVESTIDTSTNESESSTEEQTD